MGDSEKQWISETTTDVGGEHQLAIFLKTPDQPAHHSWDIEHFWTNLRPYPQVNVYIMENHHVSWENSQFLWPFSIATLT